MNWSRERIIYASIFGLAVAGLAVDRLLLDQPLTGPEAAAAAEAASSSVPTAQSPPVASGPPAVRVSVGAQVLEARYRHDPRRTEAGQAPLDAFAPPTAWVQAVASLEEPKAAPAKIVEPVTFDAKLTAIFAVAGASPTALVDGKVLQVGAVHKGFTLAELTSEAAVFVAGEQRVELRLRRAENMR